MEAVLQLAQLDVASDRAGLDALDAASVVEAEPARPLGLDEVAVDRLVDPLELQAGHRLHVERAPHVAIGVGRDEDAARRGDALEAGGAVDDLADDHEVLAGTVAERAHHHLAGVDADAHLQRDVVLGGDLGVELVERPIRIDSAARIARWGILLVGLVEAEHRHHGVADELLDDAAVGLDVLRASAGSRRR